MPQATTRRTLGVLLAGFLATTGCTDDGGSQATSAPATTTSLPSSGPTEEPPPTDDDTPRYDLTDENVAEWNRVDVIDDTTLRVFFWAGNPGCWGTRAIVEETESEVLIATITGSVPDAPGACTLEARQASLLIPLDAPLGERTISHLDLSAGIPPADPPAPGGTTE